MAAEMGAVWAIDIGNNSLKALYLSTERGVVEVVGYDNIPHGKILSGDNVTDAEREEHRAFPAGRGVKDSRRESNHFRSVPSQWHWFRHP